MLSEQQIEQRRQGLGCSELYDVLTRPYGVWHAKVTGARKFTGDEEFIRFGNLFERPTAEDYAWRRAQAGAPVRLLQTATPAGEGVTLVHPGLGWLMGTPDFLPALVRAGDLPGQVSSLADLARLLDRGAVDRGLEIKTGAAVSESHLAEEDQWGRPTPPGLVDFLAPHCGDAQWLARELMARYSLQALEGVQAAELGEDAWGEDGSAQMPRRHIVQCLGYMELTGLRRWDLHRLRFGWGRLETATYTVTWDEDLAGGILEAGARFVRDHLQTGRPPEQRSLEEAEAETARLFPRGNGALLELTPKRAGLLEAFREALIEAARADARAAVIRDRVEREIGAAAGIDGGRGFKVSLSDRDGRTSVDVQALLAGVAARLAGKVPAEEIEQLLAEARAEATKTGAPYRQISRPATWTQGIKAEVFAAMQQEGER